VTTQPAPHRPRHRRDRPAALARPQLITPPPTRHTVRGTAPPHDHMAFGGAAPRPAHPRPTAYPSTPPPSQLGARPPTPSRRPPMMPILTRHDTAATRTAVRDAEDMTVAAEVRASVLHLVHRRVVTTAVANDALAALR